MAYSILYSTGTVSVANGSTSVTGTGVTWSSVREGDTLRDPATGAFAMIASIESTSGALTLLWPWPGTDLSDDAYIITYDSPSRRSAVTLSATLETFVANQTVLLSRRADFLVLGVGTSSPPGSPVVGDTYVLGLTPSGAWSGYAGYLATWTDAGAWRFTPPETGMQALDLSVNPPPVYVRGTSAWYLRGDVPQIGDYNLLANPFGAVNAREATTGADDTYGFDRWVTLTQTAGCGLSLTYPLSGGVPTMMQLTQTQVAAQRLGQAQIFERDDSLWLSSLPVTLSGKAHCSAAATIRYAILAWTSITIGVISDPVFNWGSASYVPGSFFQPEDYTVVGVGSTALAAGVHTDITPLSVVMPSFVNNVVVVYWSEGVLPQGTTFGAGLQLSQSAVARPISHKNIAEEMVSCRRHFERIKSSASDLYHGFSHVVCKSGAEYSGILHYSAKRAAPSISASGPSTFSSTPFGPISTIGFSSAGTMSASVSGNLSNASTSGLSGLLIANNTGSAYIDISADL